MDEDDLRRLEKLQQDVAYYTMEIEGIENDMAEYSKRIRRLARQRLVYEGKLVRALQELDESVGKL